MNTLSDNELLLTITHAVSEDISTIMNFNCELAGPCLKNKYNFKIFFKIIMTTEYEARKDIIDYKLPHKMVIIGIEQFCFDDIAEFHPFSNIIENKIIESNEYLELLSYFYHNKNKNNDGYIPDLENPIPFPLINPYVSKIFSDIIGPEIEQAGYLVSIKCPNIIKTYFPIVKIDRATAQDFLPIFINKGIFSNYTSIPTKENILKKAMKKSNKTSLSFNEEREILAKAGEYKTPGYVMRDYGDYAIGFSSKLYIDYLKKSEEELKQAWKTPSIIEDENKTIKEALERIKLYKLGHKLAYITLAEAYAQKKLKGLIIPKEKIINYLGYTPEKKQIYKTIKDAFLTLRWLDYKLFDYTYTDISREYKKAKGQAVGNFIYNFDETQKEFILDINEKFVGCISHFFVEKIKNKKERKKAFKRGYFSYPTRILPLTISYTTPAYLLNDFLIRDSGNKHYNKEGLKAVTYKVERFIKEMRILHKVAGRRCKTFFDVIKEVEIIKQIEPNIEELKKLKPGKILKTLIIIYVKTPIEALDLEIKDILLSKKNKK